MSSDSCLINLTTACVVCLQSESEDYQSIFDFDEQSEVQIAEKISRCSEYQLQTENFKYPDKICSYCMDDLNAAWRFRKNCEAAKLVFESVQKQEDEASVQSSDDVKDTKFKLPADLQLTKTVDKPYEVRIKSEETDEKSVYQIEVSTENITNTTGDEHHYEVTTYYDQEALDEETEGEDGGNNVVENVDMSFDSPDDDETFYDNQEQKVKLVRTRRSTATKSSVKNETKENEQLLLKRDISKRGRGRPKKSLNDNETAKNKLSPTIFAKENRKQRSIKLDESKSNTPRKRKTGTTKPAKICEICGNCYRYQHALNAHMRRHTNDRPFGCEFCDKAFVSGVELRRHMRVHTGHKPYACQYCDRRFSDFGSRIKHERTHTGERPYSCSTCGKTFAYAHVLSVHLRTHTGEKKFQCDICEKGFTKKAYLQAHILNHNAASTRNMRKDKGFNMKISSGGLNSDEELYTTDYIVEEDDLEEIDEKPNIVIADMDQNVLIGIVEDNVEESEDVEYILDD